RLVREGRSDLGWPMAMFYLAVRLALVTLLTFLFLNMTDTVDLATQALGRQPAVWGAVFGGLGLVVLLYLANRFREERRRAGATRAVLFAAARVLVVALVVGLLVRRFGVRPLGTSLEISGYWWLAVLIPALLAGLAYVVWMYLQDVVTVGWPWGVFLAALRLSCYLLLAGIFLLPAWQLWEKTEVRSRVMGLLDVSESMSTRDDLAPEGVALDKMPSRQDK